MPLLFAPATNQRTSPPLSLSPPAGFLRSDSLSEKRSPSLRLSAPPSTALLTHQHVKDFHAALSARTQTGTSERTAPRSSKKTIVGRRGEEDREQARPAAAVAAAPEAPKRRAGQDLPSRSSWRGEERTKRKSKQAKNIKRTSIRVGGVEARPRARDSRARRFYRF